MAIHKSAVHNDGSLHTVEDWYNDETNETTRYRVDAFGAKQAIDHTVHHSDGTSTCYENENFLGIFESKGKKKSSD